MEHVRAVHREDLGAARGVGCVISHDFLPPGLRR
jgi:hypothetical protein